MITKTDWKAMYNSSGEYLGDYFNVSDYERIRMNLIELRDLANRMYPKISFEVMNEKQVNDYFYAHDINAIECNLEALVTKIFPFQIGEKKLYKANDPFLTFEELNRIEAGIGVIFQYLSGQLQGTKRLEFTCGGGNIAC